MIELRRADAHAVTALLTRCTAGPAIGIEPVGAPPQDLQWVQVALPWVVFQLGSADRVFWQRMGRALRTLEGGQCRVCVERCPPPSEAARCYWQPAWAGGNGWLHIASACEDAVTQLAALCPAAESLQMFLAEVRADYSFVGDLIQLQRSHVSLRRGTTEYQGIVRSLHPLEMEMTEQREELPLALEIGEFALEKSVATALGPGAILTIEVPERVPAVALLHGVPLYRGHLCWGKEGKIEFEIADSL